MLSAPDARELDKPCVGIDDALDSLSRLDPELNRVTELRFFGRLTIDETAHVLGVSPATIKRSCWTAKNWLQRKLSRQR